MFLDVEVYIQNHRIETKLYRKPTAGNSLLHASNHHPRHLIHSIPYGEMLRIRRACSNVEDLTIAQHQSKARFTQRGYNAEVINKAIIKANSKDRKDLLTRKDSIPTNTSNKETTETRLILTYSSQQSTLRRIINRNWSVVRGDPVIGMMMPAKPSITFRKAQSMSDLLVKSSPEMLVSTNWLNSKKVFFKCNSCRACECGINKTTYITPFTENPIKIKKNLTCRTEYVVYVLGCPCGLQYVGSTKLQAHKRILQHMRAISNNDHAYPMARHFKESHNNNLRKLTYFLIDAIPQSKRGGDQESKLRRLETKYIIELDTRIPNGHNSSEDFLTWL